MDFGRPAGAGRCSCAKQTSRPRVLVAEERGHFPDPKHKGDFVDAMRDHRRSNADIEERHRGAVLVHLGNIATRRGGRRFASDGKTEAIPGAQLVTFRDSGHVPHLEEPDSVAAAVVEFCARQEPRP